VADKIYSIRLYPSEFARPGSGKDVVPDAHKKGEVVGPAGGETGVPHCLAEVHRLLKTASFCCFQGQKYNSNNSRDSVK